MAVHREGIIRRYKMSFIISAWQYFIKLTKIIIKRLHKTTSPAQNQHIGQYRFQISCTDRQMDSNYNFRLSISIVVDNLLVQDAFSHRQCHCINFSFAQIFLHWAWVYYQKIYTNLLIFSVHTQRQQAIYLGFTVFQKHAFQSILHSTETLSHQITRIWEILR